MKRYWAAGSAALALTGMAAGALAADAAAIVKARHQNMKSIGGAVKAIGDGLKSDATTAELRLYADRLDELAPKVPSWFPRGTGPGAGVKTHAKADIWAKPAEFAAAAGAFKAEAAKLSALAAAGDRAAFTKQFGAVRGTCKGCHDPFRAED